MIIRIAMGIVVIAASVQMKHSWEVLYILSGWNYEGI